MKAELVSVVVPVYKVERYLDKCIGSIVKQTYTNLEIILVDDGSPDNCPQMCDEWAKKDARIRVIHKENGGLSDARNTALDNCTGTYVVFVDSDDYVHPEYVSYLYEMIVQHNADLAVCGYQLETPDGKRISGSDSNGQVCLMDQRTALKEICDGTRFANSAWGKIFPMKFFDDVRFPVGHIYEDLAVVHKLFLKAQKIVLVQGALYHYVWHDNSITKSAFSFKQVDAVVYAEEMSKEILEHWPDLFSTTQKRLFATYVWCWESVALSNQRSQEITLLVKELYSKITKVRKNIWGETASPKIRCFLLASYLGKTFLGLCILMKVRLHQLTRPH